jgi:hypothetical protein
MQILRLQKKERNAKKEKNAKKHLKTWKKNFGKTKRRLSKK